MTNCWIPILVYLGLFSLGWLPLWGYNLFRKYHHQMPKIFIRKLGQVFLAACVLITLYQVTTWIVIRYQLEDRRAIDFRYHNFREALLEDRYDEAYLYMTSEYRNKNTLLEFQEWTEDYYFPELQPDRLVSISLFTNSAELSPEYDIYGDILHSSIVLGWEKVDDEWYLTGKIVYMLD